ncbi:MAG: hypothetical protein ABIG84_07410 [archaeon]
MKTRKGQYYIVKPIALVMTLIVIFMLIYSLQNYKYDAYNDALTIDTIIDTKDTLSILANSIDCLAYESKDPKDKGIYGSIVSTEKLDEFNRTYQKVEPECARNYMSGWHAEVIDLTSGEAWTFGTTEYSKKMANEVLDQRRVSTIPIAIRHSDKEINPGNIKITTFAGDLERVAGFIDYTCMTGRRGYATYSDSKTFHINHPILLENNTLCLVLGKEKMCRELYCEVFFDGIQMDGEYKISAKYMLNSDNVVIKS